MSKKKKILVLEPYYGGSHKAFLKGLSQYIHLDFDFLTLPAHKWKWRMRLSAPYFAEKLAQLPPGSHVYDVILCSTFVDVASFKGLAPGWVGDIPILTYFHENQFAYPVQVEMERDFHFALTNFTTALASDRLAFNSQYNFDTFIAGCAELLKKSHDLKVENFAEDIRRKSEIIYPGVSFTDIDTARSPVLTRPPAVVWNHRWEHDKNPEMFFEALLELQNQGVFFEVILLGQSFRSQPRIFQQAAEKLGERVIQYGYATSRQQYINFLRQGDVVVSTAMHEFFGISIIEAVRAGCRPLLPKRLSYPELFPDKYLYDDQQFTRKLAQCLKSGRLDIMESRELTAAFSWPALAKKYEQWFSAV